MPSIESKGPMRSFLLLLPIREEFQTLRGSEVIGVEIGICGAAPFIVMEPLCCLQPIFPKHFRLQKVDRHFYTYTRVRFHHNSSDCHVCMIHLFQNNPQCTEKLTFKTHKCKIYQ